MSLDQAYADHYVRTRSAPTETAERPFLVRSFDAVVEVEGRTVDVRLVPFGEVARVADPPDWDPYDEEWLPGCFDHQLNAANRVHANYEHERGISNVVGHGVALRNESDGYHLTTTIHKTSAGDTTLELIHAGALPGVSLEAQPVRNTRTTSGVIQRVKANLRGMAFCRQGAFAGAQVLAVRGELEPEVTVDELAAELLPVDLDPQVVERYRLLGLELPERYRAHPDSTGTPDESGTPDVSGTRQMDVTSHTSEE